MKVGGSKIAIVIIIIIGFDINKGQNSAGQWN